MVSVYNPTDRTFEVAAPDGSVHVFLDNTCKDVEESVARVALAQHPQLKVLGELPILTQETGETEQEEIERLEREIDSSEMQVEAGLHQAPDGSVQLLQASDLAAIGVDTTGMEYFCSHPGCQNKYTNVVIFKQHMKAHDQRDRHEVAAKVVEIQTKKRGRKPKEKTYETNDAKEHEESDAKEGSEESSSKEEGSSKEEKII